MLKTKYKTSCDIERRKARIVARGFSQRPGLDYTDTYSPVVKLSSIRTLIAKAIEENMHIDQLDITTGSLNGEIDESIFMKNLKTYRNSY